MNQIQLKGNKVTSDIKLDRLEQFDARSRKFDIADLREEKRIRSYTWRCNSWFDQGKEGACVGFAIGHELAARPGEVRGLTNKKLKENIYWEAQKKDRWPGGSYPGARPRYEGTSVLAGIKVAKSLGYFEEFRWAFNFNDLIYGLGHNGPAILGVRWYSSMYKPNAKGFISPSGSVSGGHAILARAVNVKKEFVTLRNSWGKSWGKGGDCYISFGDLERLLSKRGEAAFLLKRKSKVT